MKKFYGFSLLEILVVVTIISLMGTFSVPIYKARMIKAKVSTNLIPVLYAYRNKAMVLLEQAGKGTPCITSSLRDFTATNMVSAVGFRYFPEDSTAVREEFRGANFIQVVAVMGRNGIGIDAIGGRPLILELSIKKNGDAIDWDCRTSKEYFEYVPQACKNDRLLPYNTTSHDQASNVWQTAGLEECQFQCYGTGTVTGGVNLRPWSKYADVSAGDCQQMADNVPTLSWPSERDSFFKWSSCSSCDHNK